MHPSIAAKTRRDYRVIAHAAFLPGSANNLFRGHREDIVIDLGIDNKVPVGKKHQQRATRRC